MPIDSRPPAPARARATLDWLISIGLLPVSYAVTGPIAGVIGVRATLIGAGVLGGIATLAFMLVPGLYDTERDGSIPEAAVVPVDDVHRQEALL
jgi:hypothetical protein